MAEPSPAAELSRLVGGYQVSQALHVAATLGIADLLADGPRTSDELAEAAGAHPRELYRLLRALATVGVLHEDEGRRFSLTELGDTLRTDAPGSIRGWAMLIGRPYFLNAWAHLLTSVREGGNSFRHAYGTDIWSYRAEHPEESAIFDEAMTSRTRAANAAVLDAYDFTRFGTVVDVAGGRGVLLAALLERHHGMQGILFDQPHVVAKAAPLLEEAGVADRCRVVAGSFFESVPEGGDAYVLKWILHDWEDEDARAILRAVHRAAAPNGAMVIVVERDLGGPNEDPEAKFSDLNMLVAPGGLERTIPEYEALFAAAGFRLTGVIPTASGLHVLEASSG
jgi:hypothetical protein